MYFNEFLKGNLLSTTKSEAIYSGLSQQTGQLVIIKVISLEKIFDADKLSIIRNKLCTIYRTLISINHKNLINVIKIDVDYINTMNLSNIRNEFIFVSEYSDGETIKSLLERYGRLDERLIKKYTRDILEGLIYLQEKGLALHKNLNSSNVLIDRDGTVRISNAMVDSALMGEGEDLITRLKKREEIPYWISPDLVLDPRLDNVCVDLWSLGCLIVEMSTGRSPWDKYNFRASSDFIDFLFSTILIKPEYPNELSEDCHSFLDILFTRFLENNEGSPLRIEDLVKHEFFLDSNSCFKKREENILRKKSIVTKMFPINIIDRNLGSKFFNLLKSNEDNEMFTISMTLQSQTFSEKKLYNIQNNMLRLLNVSDSNNRMNPNLSRVSYLEKKTNLLLTSQNKKLYLLEKNNIDEEIDSRKEYTPTADNLAKENNFFNGEFSFKESQYESAIGDSALKKSQFIENIGPDNENENDSESENEDTIKFTEINEEIFAIREKREHLQQMIHETSKLNYLPNSKIVNMVNDDKSFSNKIRKKSINSVYL